MMKRLIMTGLACVMTLVLAAQVDDDWNKKVRESQQNAREEYEKFRQQAEQEYNDFRRRANEEYARFMENPWKAFETQPAEEIPVLPKPPVPINIDPNAHPYPVPIPYEGTPVPLVPEIHPEPVEPITPTVQPDVPVTLICFYGTDITFHLPTAQPPLLKDASEKSVADLWTKLSQPTFDNMIAECLQRRAEMNLCDWGYIILTEQVAEAYYGSHTNEAVVLHMFLLTQSGYQLRIGRTEENQLFVLIGSNERIYHYKYCKIKGVNYYNFNKSLDNKPCYIFDCAFPKEKLMSLAMSQPQLTVKETQPRTLVAKRYPQVKATVVLNQNLIEFFNSCPLNARWELYSKASLSDIAKSALYPVLRKAIDGRTQAEAAIILINFVQTAFDYATDQNQFGYERPLYPDEALYYPYCDCEDRSILFACLVRELMGLEVVLLDYPEHLATAVCFTEDVEGDWLNVDGKKYIVCDPTYIGADIGMSMPSMREISPKVVLINSNGL